MNNGRSQRPISTGGLSHFSNSHRSAAIMSKGVSLRCASQSFDLFDFVTAAAFAVSGKGGQEL